MISLNRQFVSSAVPNPANIRIVHNFDRYIDAYGPRVNGNSPGYSNGPSPSSLAGPYTGSDGIPDNVTKSASRIGDVKNARSHISRFVPITTPSARARRADRSVGDPRRPRRRAPTS